MKNPVVVFCPGCAAAQIVSVDYVARVQATSEKETLGFFCAECFLRGELFMKAALAYPKKLSERESRKRS